MSVIEFFIPMESISNTTHQQKSITWDHKKKRPIVYEGEKLRNARAQYEAWLAPHRPKEPLKGALQLVMKWQYDKVGVKYPKPKTTKPDTDNLVKLPKDVMTKLGFWKDDAQIASEIVEKYWTGYGVSGLYIRIEEL